MYGTVARLHVTAGAEEEIQRINDASAAIPGLVSSVVYRSDTDPQEYWLAVVFESKDAYRRNAESPEQNARYEQLRALLDAEPEWHDGETVAQYPPR